MADNDEETPASIAPETAGKKDSTVSSSNQDEPPEPNKIGTDAQSGAADAMMVVEYDDFGLPIRRRANEIQYEEEQKAAKEKAHEEEEEEGRDRSGSKGDEATMNGSQSPGKSSSDGCVNEDGAGSSSEEEGDFKDAVATPPKPDEPASEQPKTAAEAADSEAVKEDGPALPGSEQQESTPNVAETEVVASKDQESNLTPSSEIPGKDAGEEKKAGLDSKPDDIKTTDLAAAELQRDSIQAPTPGLNGVSEFSHQQVALPKKEEEEDTDGGWQTMPAFAPYDLYDDDNKLIAKEYNDEEEDQTYSYAGMGGAGRGYTRVLVDDDAESVTSMDDNTNYLFKNAPGTSIVEDEETRDAVSQMQATKDLLTEGQKIAYVGLTRIELSQMVKDVEKVPLTKTTKKAVQLATEATKMWGQKIMIRLYTHMDISAAEQVMIEQLSEHGVISSDLTPQLMANARVKNPMADRKDSVSTSRPSSVSSPKPSSTVFSSPGRSSDEEPAEAPPAYDKHEGEELPAVRTPNQLPSTEKLDIDLRWTILCDLFLVLIADSVYDSRSRVLLERVAKALEIDWIDICRFERRVTEALEMQQQAERENWNEGEHMESRRKLALKKRYIVMGLATVGGGLVIGLSAGLLAPVIGAGLAAGFTTIGVAGTSSFLGGAAASAIITSGAAASGGVIGARAANRRTGSVKTFEYRPLHNNKRVNLIVTISGWMTGKVDDVRLPFSTVDPMMGDIYSVLWEPEMLTSMGDTINILATEVRYNSSRDRQDMKLTSFPGPHARSAASPRKHHPRRSDGGSAIACRLDQALLPDRQPMVCIA